MYLLCPSVFLEISKQLEIDINGIIIAYGLIDSVGMFLLEKSAEEKMSPFYACISRPK